ncbi:MAG: LacI family DNA-binding transcriptional regulator [Eubacteriales bacterium]|nr:LacI family DNA-binding transcriptional regulator [Eubacteriales bacterium]
MRIRISDIAEELGLSTATVSNVIHGKTNKVSDETVKRVQALLEQRQYIPSMAGILLAQNSSKIIGVFVNDHEKYEGHTLDDAFIASSLNALSSEIEKSGQFMMVKKAKHPEEVLKFASMWNMEGLVMMGFCQQDYRYLRSHMRIPFVVYDGYCDDPQGIVNITIDNFGGGFQVGRLFRDKGYARAICISDNETGVDQERIDGFRSGFHGAVDVMMVPMRRAERRQQYLRQIERFRRVSAVFAVSDYYAIDLMQFLGENGICVPGDAAVAGFDGTPMSELVFPALTTVRQDSGLRAKTAMEKLRELQENRETQTSVMLPVTLIERESTG